MPEKLHKCVSDLGKGMDDDSSWAICNSAIDEVEQTTKESHNPLDIPFGYELTETVCKSCTQEKSLKHDILNSKLK